MEKSLVTHLLGQVPLSCILVPFESIVGFLDPSLSLVTGLCASCYACTCFGLFIGCWMDNVARWSHLPNMHTYLVNLDCLPTILSLIDLLGIR